MHEIAIDTDVGTHLGVSRIVDYAFPIARDRESSDVIVTNKLLRRHLE